MKPKISYVICAVQRSGSFLLCEALKNTGLAGYLEEYFLNGEGWEDSSWAREHGVISRKDYLNLVFEQGTSSNGVFGTKVMWNYFPAMLKSLRELPEYKGLNPPQLMASLFPNVHYIWMVRQDKVRQAVSWAKAGQTDVYAWHKGETPIPKRKPTFDFEFINHLYDLILDGEAGWRNFFEAYENQPLKVEYENLVEAYEPTALGILDYLHIPHPGNLTFGERKLQQQSDSLNEVWVKKYIEMKQAR
jgi:trehalose 2-sulfotransferase